MNYSPTTYYASEDIQIKELIAAMWRGKWWILGASFVAAIISIIAVLRLPNIYTAEVVMSPVVEANSSLPSIAGRLGDLASLAGVNVAGGAGVDLTTLGMQTLNSRIFLTQFIERHDLKVPLLATKGWDLRSKRWEIDSDVYNENDKRWVRNVSPPETPEPSDWDAYKSLKNAISITQDKKTQIITLAVKSKSPIYARLWAELLVKDLNDYLRAREVDQAQRSIAFLERQLEGTSVAQMQTILYQLIEEQTKTIMLASVRDGYAFQVIDPAVVPEEKSGPKRAMIVMLSVLASIVISIMVLLVLVSNNKK